MITLKKQNGKFIVKVNGMTFESMDLSNCIDFIGAVRGMQRGEKSGFKKSN